MTSELASLLERATPGPWRADDFGLIYRDGDGKSLLGSFNMMRPGGGNPIEARANGLLAASAPDLYEALYRLCVDGALTGLDQQAGWDAFFAMGRAALAKARGEALTTSGGK